MHTRIPARIHACVSCSDDLSLHLPESVPPFSPIQTSSSLLPSLLRPHPPSHAPLLLFISDLSIVLPSSHYNDYLLGFDLKSATKVQGYDKYVILMSVGGGGGKGEKNLADRFRKPETNVWRMMVGGDGDRARKVDCRDVEERVCPCCSGGSLITLVLSF
jgi:hypothetical protein